MNVLIACEESQTSCKAFRERGHVAFSADIQKCSGWHPEWHILGDCLTVINGNCSFICENGDMYKIKGQWDLIIAHPPCTFLSNLNYQYTNVDSKKYKKHQVLSRLLKQIQASYFFMKMYNAKCDKVCVENPIGYMNTHFRKPDMIVHPYYFGDNDLKRTAFWTRGLPLLVYNKNAEKPKPYKFRGSSQTKNGKKPVYYMDLCLNLPPKERAIIRSKTFPSIAKAFAEQWGIFETKSFIQKIRG